MSKFTAQQLVELAEAVYAGAELEHLTDSGWTALGSKAETVDALLHSWRIKPAKKIIDMAHFIESGIDMEFWDDASDSYTNISILDSINVGLNHAFVSKLSCYKHCRPRMNHKMFHGGGACPLPEGFMVEVYYRSGGALSGNVTDFHWLYSKTSGCVADIIGYEVLGLADGWAYPWESDE